MGRRTEIELDAALAAFVLRIGRYGSEHGVLAAIRSLGLLGVRVYTGRGGSVSPANCSRYLTATVPLPTTDADDRLVDALATALDAIDGHVLLVPTDDKAAIFLNERAQVLRPQAVVVTPPQGVARQLVDKHRCADLLASCGASTPPSRVLVGPVGADDAASIVLPAVMKRRTRTVYADGAWSPSTAIVRTAADLRAVLARVDADRASIVVQPLIAGRDWLWHAYVDQRGTVAFAHTAVKLVSDGPGGATLVAVTRPNPRLSALMSSIARRVGYVGPISADVREGWDGTLYVLDVNPRLGACFRLFTAVGGLDPLRACHLEASGREVPEQDVADGCYYVVDDRPGPFSRRFTPRRPRVASVERAWRSATDPLPNLARHAVRLRSRLLRVVCGDADT